MLVILLRTVIIYIVLIILVRMTGKRQIGEMQISDLVTALMLSELAVAPITNLNIPLLFAILPILTLITVEIIITFVVTKSKFLKHLFYGEPSFIIHRGILDRNELVKLRISIEEFMGELRLKDIADINDVNYAIIEQNGRLSVFPKSSSKAITAGDLSIRKTDSGISYPVIVDSEINYNNLKLSGHSEEWLNMRLNNRKIKLCDVFLFAVDDSGKEHLILKES
jgi:uncharacterized membrane protein YcaP (DUF421 family)